MGSNLLYSALTYDAHGLLFISNEIRNFGTWTNDTFSDFKIWWNDIFGTESALKLLKDFGTNLSASLVGTLYQNIYDLLQEQLLPTSKSFDIWVFTLVTKIMSLVQETFYLKISQFLLDIILS